MPKKGSKKEKVQHTDARQMVAEKLGRVADRMDTLNRKYFAGTSTFLREGGIQMAAAKAGVLALPKTWEPQARGKKALIPGAIIRVKADLTKEEMVTIDHMGGAARFKGAKIIAEDDNRSVIIELKDGTKTIIGKRKIEIDTVDEEKEEEKSEEKEKKK